MEWRIRDATGADSLAAATVVRAVYDEFGFTWEEGGYHADLYDLETHYLAPGGRFWLCEAGAQVVGVIGLEVFPLVPGEVGEVVLHEGKKRAGGATCSLERLYVLPEARRFGVGSALAEACVGQARSAGHRAMEIWSDKAFADAHRLYQRYGARVIGERICDDPDQAEEWGLILELA